MNMRILAFFTLCIIGCNMNAQSYLSPNVHYYLPVGFSTQDWGETVTMPHGGTTVLAPYILIDMGNGSIRVQLGPNNNRSSREQVIDALNKVARGVGIWGGGFIYQYDSSLSTYKRNVYKRVVSPNMFGPGGVYYIAIAKDWSSYIDWKGGNEDKRIQYYKIDIEEILPNAPNRDFLYE